MMYQEKRKHKRKHLYEYFEVVDTSTGKLFGKLVDVTPEGLKIILCPKSIAPGSVLHLKIRIPEELKIPDIQVEANCMWSAEDENCYQNGFIINCVSEYDAHHFKKIFG